MLEIKNEKERKPPLKRVSRIKWQCMYNVRLQIGL